MNLTIKIVIGILLLIWIDLGPIIFGPSIAEQLPWKGGQSGH